jgi:hypothetical protein
MKDVLNLGVYVTTARAAYSQALLRMPIQSEIEYVPAFLVYKSNIGMASNTRVVKET